MPELQFPLARPGGRSRSRCRGARGNHPQGPPIVCCAPDHGHRGHLRFAPTGAGGYPSPLRGSAYLGRPGCHLTSGPGGPNVEPSAQRSFGAWRGRIWHRGNRLREAGGTTCLCPDAAQLVGPRIPCGSAGREAAGRWTGPGNGRISRSVAGAPGPARRSNPRPTLAVQRRQTPPAPQGCRAKAGMPSRNRRHTQRSQRLASRKVACPFSPSLFPFHTGRSRLRVPRTSSGLSGLIPHGQKPPPGAPDKPRLVRPHSTRAEAASGCPVTIRDDN